MPGLAWADSLIEVGFGVAGINANDQIHIGNSWFILAQGSADQGVVDEGIDILGVKHTASTTLGVISAVVDPLDYRRYRI